MKKYIYILTVLLLTLFTPSCMDTFIEKPNVIGMNLDEVFSTSKNAEGAITEAYATILSSGLPALNWNPPFLPFESTEAIMGGEDLCKLGWSYMDKQVSSGMLANDQNSGAGYTDDFFPNNYAFIRKAWLVYENIDKVSDMTPREKNIVKAEMQTLVAFRYVEMLKRYGGVPVVESTLTTVDVRERSTVQVTIDFILKLCNEAATTLEGVVWSANWMGRVNKGVALAVKAEALTYAARPLFNTGTPYMQMSDPMKNDLICLGSYDSKRWDAAIKANQDVIDWGKSNNYVLIDTDNPLADYGTAVGTPSNSEVLLAYKQQEENDENGIYKNYTFMPTKTGHDVSQYRGTSYQQLGMYRKANGTDQIWPSVSEVWHPASEYREKSEELEPRAHASLFFYGVQPKNNSGNARWDLYQNWQFYYRGQDGCAKNVKFWYQAGTREWFEFPIYRMAEFYLNIAEGYNALGNASNSLEYLNIIRDRGGLDDETVTDHSLLTKSIQREWAVEFYQENQWYPHARHWKEGASMIGGDKFKFEFTRADGVTWDPRTPEEFKEYARKRSYVSTYAWRENMSLSPFTLDEINKGYLVQNPGY